MINKISLKWASLYLILTLFMVPEVRLTKDRKQDTDIIHKILVLTDKIVLPITEDLMLKKRNCKFDNCYVKNEDIRKDGLFLNATAFDAIIFNSTLSSKIMPITLKRLESQMYIFACNEPASKFPIDSDFDWFFNETWTYKLDSDIYSGSIVVRDIDSSIVGPRKVMHWKRSSETEYIGEELKDIISNKKRAALWISVGCDVTSPYADFMFHLNSYLMQYYLSLDIFFKCGDVFCKTNNNVVHCGNEIDFNVYFFILTFENDFAEDYVTDLILYPLRNFAVPVVSGGANYSRFLPDDAYIDATEVKPEELAAQMFKLISNKERYYAFFKWRNYYSFHETMDRPDTDPWCALCAMLNDKRKRAEERKVYAHLSRWWNSGQDSISSLNNNAHAIISFIEPNPVIIFHKSIAKDNLKNDDIKPLQLPENPYQLILKNTKESISAEDTNFRKFMESSFWHTIDDIETTANSSGTHAHDNLFEKEINRNEELKIILNSDNSKTLGTVNQNKYIEKDSNLTNTDKDISNIPFPNNNLGRIPNIYSNIYSNQRKDNELGNNMYPYNIPKTDPSVPNRKLSIGEMIDSDIQYQNKPNKLHHGDAIKEGTVLKPNASIFNSPKSKEDSITFRMLQFDNLENNNPGYKRQPNFRDNSTKIDLIAVSQLNMPSQKIDSIQNINSEKILNQVNPTKDQIQNEAMNSKEKNLNRTNYIDINKISKSVSNQNNPYVKTVLTGRNEILHTILNQDNPTRDKDNPPRHTDIGGNKISDNVQKNDATKPLVASENEVLHNLLNHYHPTLEDKSGKNQKIQENLKGIYEQGNLRENSFQEETVPNNNLRNRLEAPSATVRPYNSYWDTPGPGEGLVYRIPGIPKVPSITTNFDDKTKVQDKMKEANLQPTDSYMLK